MNLKKSNQPNWDESEDSPNLYHPTNFPPDNPSSQPHHELLLPSSHQLRPQETRARAAKNRAKINYKDEEPKESI